MLDRSGAENLLAYFCRELLSSTSYTYQQMANLGDRTATKKCDIVKLDYGTEKLDAILIKTFEQKKGLALLQFSFIHPQGKYRGFGGIVFNTTPGYTLEELPKEEVETMLDLHKLTDTYFSKHCPPVTREQVNAD